jgi:hypothetical protein
LAARAPRVGLKDVLTISASEPRFLSDTEALWLRLMISRRSIWVNIDSGSFVSHSRFVRPLAVVN